MEKRSLLFKETLIFKEKKYFAGYAYVLELEPYEFNRLTRMGCIYADKNAKYYEEDNKIQKKRSRKKKVDLLEEKNNVDNKDIEQAEVQANDSAQD